MSTSRPASLTICILAGVLVVLGPWSQSPADELDDFLVEQMAIAHVPGLSTCIVVGDEVVWDGAYGWADIDNAIPVTDETAFMLASVSKLTVGTALMQLAEQGRIDLDDPIAPWLGFPVENPNHPDDEIVFRQLLTHVSSLEDNWDVFNPLYVHGDSDLPLGDFLADYFTPGGEYYSATRNFYGYEPGVNYNYANIGFDLTGHLIASITGQSFDEYCNAGIFGPLGMTETSWFLAGFDDLTKVANQYGWSNQQGDYAYYGMTGHPSYPSGQLRTTATQLAKLLIAHMHGGVYHDARILEPESVAEMHTVQFPEVEPSQGLAFYYLYWNGWTLLGHSGSDIGVTTDCWYGPDDGVGVIMLTNGQPRGGPEYDAYNNIFNRLYEEGLAYSPSCEGDANGDGAVDPLDSGYVLARLGCLVSTGEDDCDAADQNGDGFVDPLDVGFVLARLGLCEQA